MPSHAYMNPPNLLLFVGSGKDRHDVPKALGAGVEFLALLLINKLFSLEQVRNSSKSQCIIGEMWIIIKIHSA